MGRVFIAGSMNMDVVAFCDRLPVPGETRLGSRLGFFPGGKGLNPAVASARQGAETHLLARVGRDAFGSQLHAFAESSGIRTDGVVKDPDQPTGTAVIVVSDAGENSIVVVPGSNGQLSPRDFGHIEIAADDVLLTLFEIPLATCRAFLELGRLQGARTVLSPSPAATCSFLDLPDIIVLNESELDFYGGNHSSPPASIEERGRSLLRRVGQTVLVTLGHEGSMAITRSESIRVPGIAVEAMDTTGAGDCFTGSLVARMASGDDLEAAMKYANVAASICVTRPGAAPSMPTRAEVLAKFLAT